MGRRFVGSLLIVTTVFLALPGIASAHVLKVDGDIGAVLHINPDDNPTTGGSTDYILSFDDDSGRFSLPKCNCDVSIIQAGKTIATKPLVDSSDQVSENHYTFPAPAVYIMRFTGTPKTPGAFQPFTLDYEERVTNGQLNAQPMPVLLWIGLAMGIGLILLGAYAMDYDASETSRKESS
ncbi:MAG TPA: hypothetical protein VHC21_01615 [Candidatus Saccharimonadales bacterium]|nr:hypothetical protein [Candidatus Saccharimonadales bacterium]